jgi:hypothetical protein
MVNWPGQPAQPAPTQPLASEPASRAAAAAAGGERPQRDSNPCLHLTGWPDYRCHDAEQGYRCAGEPRCTSSGRLQRTSVGGILAEPTPLAPMMCRGFTRLPLAALTAAGLSARSCDSLTVGLVKRVEPKPRLPEVGEGLIEAGSVIFAEKVNAFTTTHAEGFCYQGSADTPTAKSRVHGDQGQKRLNLAIAQQLREADDVSLVERHDGRNSRGRESPGGAHRILRERRPAFSNAQ